MAVKSTDPAGKKAWIQIPAQLHCTNSSEPHFLIYKMGLLKPTLPRVAVKVK